VGSTSDTAGRISGATRVVGIIGDPVAHSLSPAMHNAAFAALGLDMVYVPLPVAAGQLGAAVGGLAALGFRGANVTVPHKGAVVPFLSWLDDDARLAQAVNTIVVDGRLSRGYNTDIDGARSALVEACGESLRGESALLLGAGGAARAVALALARLGVRVTVCNRTAEKAAHVVDLVRAAEPSAVGRWLPFEGLTPGEVAGHRLLVNATSLGMGGAGKVPAPLVDTVTAGQVVFDVVYGHTETDLLRRARERGAVVVDGLAMLVAQAAAAFGLWTGRSAPRDVMRQALQRRRE
jgi:shikimate dehydrogenase